MGAPLAEKMIASSQKFTFSFFSVCLDCTQAILQLELYALYQKRKKLQMTTKQRTNLDWCVLQMLLQVNWIPMQCSNGLTLTPTNLY